MSALSPTPALSAAGPRPGQSFARQSRTHVAPVDIDPCQRPAIAVGAVAVELDATAGKKLRQPRGRPTGKKTLRLAAPVHLRRVDPLDPDLLAGQPQRVAIDDTGDALAWATDRHCASRPGKNPGRRGNHGDHTLHNRFSPAAPIRHLGTFEAEALRRAGPFTLPATGETIARDLASAIAMVAFVASVAVILAAIFNGGAPA